MIYSGLHKDMGVNVSATSEKSRRSFGISMSANDFQSRRIDLYDKIKADQATQQKDPTPVNVRLGPDTLQGVNVMGVLKKSQKKETLLARVKYDEESDLPVIKDPDGIEDDSEWRLQALHEPL